MATQPNHQVQLRLLAAVRFLLHAVSGRMPLTEACHEGIRSIERALDFMPLGEQKETNLDD